MRTPRIVAVLIFAIAVCLNSGSAVAWEADVHYGLVKWLAVQAGYSLADSEIVAERSYAPDKSHIASAIDIAVDDLCLTWRAVLPERFYDTGPLKTASDQVRDQHFPTRGGAASAPEDREVEAGSAAALAALGNAIAATPAEAGREERLSRFGVALHAYADSWSHRGVPDVPPSCLADYVWSHPKARGGWFRHKADLTHEHEDEVLKLAQQVFDRMVEFCAASADIDCRDAKWSDDLESRVAAFARAENALAKRAWFREQAKLHPKIEYPGEYEKYPCFLRETSLSGATYVDCTYDIDPFLGRPVVLAAAGTPEGLAEDVSSLLTDWVVERQYDAVIARMDLDRVYENLFGEDDQRERFEVLDKYERETVLRTLLQAWLIRDHGWVDQQGHGLPAGARFDLLVDPGPDRPLVEAKDGQLGEIIGARGSDGAPFVVRRLPDIEGQPPRFRVVFGFHHAPEDTLSLGISPSGDDVEIFALTWQIH